MIFDNRAMLEAAGGKEPSTIPFARGEVESPEELGGLFRHYYRKAA